MSPKQHRFNVGIAMGVMLGLLGISGYAYTAPVPQSVAMLPASAGAQGIPLLAPGDQAPEIKVAEWLKGAPFQSWDKNRLSVVEFWATWCMPCKEMIPHLSILAKKYAGSVGIYSISTEETPDVAEKVHKFIQENGDAMQYSVGRDTDQKNAENFMLGNWLMRSRQRGIPVSYLIDSGGKLLWLGHPLDLEKAIDSALASKLDVAKERKAFEAYLAKDDLMNQFLAKLHPADLKFEAGDRAGAFHDLDAAAGRNQAFKYITDREEMRLLAIYDGDVCLNFLSGLRRRVKRDSWWRYVVEFTSVDGRVKNRAGYDALRIKIAQEFIKASDDKDPWLIGYSAMVLRSAGDRDQAASAFERAEHVFPGSRAARDPGETKRFEEFIKSQR